MINRNRLANTKNPYQGKHRKVLCICSAGLLRSPTIAWVLSNPPYNCNVRAAGINAEYALIPVDEALLEWADIIVCAEAEHLPEECGKPNYVLGAPDIYEARSKAMIGKIVTALEHVGFPTDKALNSTV